MKTHPSLHRMLFTPDIKKSPTRDGFGDALVEIAQFNKKIIGLSGDLTESVRMERFSEEFPDRFFNVGIAEQNMVGIAAGLAMEGWIPFAATYSTFFGRAWDHIRVQVAMGALNVKLIGTHAGISTGADGATAQALEDIAMLRALPNLTIVCPCDAGEAKKAVAAVVDMTGPVYLRLTRNPVASITTANSPFVLGRMERFVEGSDVTIVACGAMVYNALEAARQLSVDGITAEVLNAHTIKPLDAETLIKSVRKTGAVVTVEDHQVIGGLGSAVAEELSKQLPVPLEYVGVSNRFGESGTAEELQKKYGLTPEAIIKSVKRVTKRKTQTKAR